MNFYCDSQGVVFHVDAERIFQGSLGANKIRLIGQFPSTAQVLMAYELPDGTKTSTEIRTPVATLEQVQAPNGGLYSIWESLIGATPKIDDNGNVVTDDNGDIVYDLIPAITALYGTVRVQFFVYGASSGKLNGQVLAVASSSFTVEKGVPAEIPEFNLDDGTALLQNILAIVANYETIVENSVFDGFVKKTGDTMTGPLIVENSRSLGRSGVIPDGFHVQSGEEAETHYGQGFILRKADTNAYPNGTFEEIVNALPQGSGTLATEEYVDDKADTISQDIAVVNAILEQSGIVSKYKATVEDTYSERVTADGANVLDGSKAVLKKVVGSTVACKNFFNPFVLSVQAETNTNWIKSVTENKIIIGVKSGLSVNTGKTLQDFCPALKVGQTVWLNGESTGYGSINLSGTISTAWLFGKSITITKEQLTATVAIPLNENGGAGDVTITNLRITESQNEPFTPYFTGLKSASFGGIESTNADGTKTATLDFPKTETPLGTTIDFENKKITDYGVDLVLTGTEKWVMRGQTFNDVSHFYALILDNTNYNFGEGVCTDFDKLSALINKVGFAVGAMNAALYLSVDKTQFTSVDDLKEWLAQRYADGNPVKIRYLSSVLQSETPFTADNEYTAYNGGTEKVLDNDGKDYGAENTLSQNYIIVTEV